MKDGLIILLIIILMFGLMYLWAYSSVYLEKRKRDRISECEIRKDEQYKEKKVKNQQIRDGKKNLLKNRSEEIKRHFEWLEGINKDLKRREETIQEQNN
ncbi:MAG: hypothetical protein KAJ28_06635 [Flavobacteriaceae bacterium]|nr:hypothetical protein [Flavobacteriaceae bacterium]